MCLVCAFNKQVEHPKRKGAYITIVVLFPIMLVLQRCLFNFFSFALFETGNPYWCHCSCICKIGCMVLVTQRNWLVRLGETGPVGWDDCKMFHFGSLPGVYIFSTIWYIYFCLFGVLVQNVDFDIHIDVAYLIYFFPLLLSPFIKSDVDYRWWY